MKRIQGVTRGQLTRAVPPLDKIQHLGKISVRSAAALSTNGAHQSADAYRAWYRGSNDPNINGGGPVLVDGSIVITGASLAQIAATGWGQIQFLYSMRPFAGCNWDALRGIRVHAYVQSAAGLNPGTTLTSIYDGVVVAPDRRYWNPNNDADAANWLEPVVFNQIENGAYGNALAVSLQLYGVAGNSGGRCFYSPAGWANGNALMDNGATFPSAWGGGGGIPVPPPPGGSEPPANCVDPDTLITTSGGLLVRAGSLGVGDRIWTRHEHVPGIEGWRNAAIGAISTHDAEERWLLTLDDGRTLLASTGHRVNGEGNGWPEVQALVPGDRLALGGVVQSVTPRGPGPVVKITVPGCGTYVSAGILSHNAKRE